MKQNDFYEVDGCMDFIPVKLIEEHKHMTNTLRVELTETGDRAFVPHMYSFPKVTEPQKVVVPKFVAEWIKSQKESFSDASAIDMYDNLTLDNNGGYYHDVWLWVIDHHYDFIKAWHDGYTVEKEKLYTVEIPNPALDNLEFVIVLKRIRGRVCLVNAYDYMGRELSDEYHLTESEIKQDFDFLWQFAKEVE